MKQSIIEYGLTSSEQTEAKQFGAFATAEFAESHSDVKIRLALNPQRKNALYIEEKILVPKNVILNIGVIVSVTLLIGTMLECDSAQILLHQNWSEKWIVGYRFVTSEPLMNCLSIQLKNLMKYNGNTIPIDNTLQLMMKYSKTLMSS